MRKQTTIIAFSGGCLSGKTTVATKLLNSLLAKGYDARIIQKVRYNKPFDSIDSVRRNPSEYLAYEEYVCRGMMDLERDVFEQKENQVVILDRCTIDSLFYLTFYLDKSHLTHAELITMHNLINDMLTHCYFAAENIYDLLCQFEPIGVTGNGGHLRPAEWAILKNIESSMIKMFAQSFMPIDSLVSVQASNLVNIVNHLTTKIHEVYKNKGR